VDKSKRYLGIDYGTKRIGLAISDEQGKLAFPKEIVTSNALAPKYIADAAQANGIVGIVVGESVNFEGKENAVSKKIEEFVNSLKTISPIPIYREKEFLTSIEARKVINLKEDSQVSAAHTKVKKEIGARADAGAAALILQRYLDRLNNPR
jgi:putative Holliday junction resolvase